MAKWFDDRVALVTGGASGIGRATALAFAREGARTVVSDVDVDGGQGTVDIIEDSGGEATFVKADVTSADEVEGLVARTVQTYGRLDCAFNNAGLEREMTSPAERHSEETFQSVIDANLRGVWLCMKSEIAQMLEQGSGAIVNASSVAGLVGIPNQPIYVASKHAVSGLTKSFAVEYAGRGIRVNAVCPGLVDTPLMDRIYASNPEMKAEADSWQPIGRTARPEEIAEAVIWLCSDKASFVVGHMMTIDGGLVVR